MTTHVPSGKPSIVISAPIEFFEQADVLHEEIVFLKPKELCYMESLTHITGIFLLASSSPTVLHKAQTLVGQKNCHISKSIPGLIALINKHLGEIKLRSEGRYGSGGNWFNRPILDYKSYCVSQHPKWQSLIEESGRLVKRLTRKNQFGHAVASQVFWQNHPYSNLESAIYSALQVDRWYSIGKLYSEIKSNDGHTIPKKVLHRAVQNVRRVANQTRSSLTN
jgi:hypothetical protein